MITRHHLTSALEKYLHELLKREEIRMRVISGIKQTTSNNTNKHLNWTRAQSSLSPLFYFISFSSSRAVSISPPFLPPPPFSPLSPLHLHPLFPHSLVTHPKSQTQLTNPNIPHTRNPIRKNEPNLLQPLIHHPNSNPTSNFHVINPTQLLMICRIDGCERSERDSGI